MLTLGVVDTLMLSHHSDNAVAAEGEETQAAGQEGTQTSGQDTAAAGPSTAIQVEMGPGWNL